MNPSSSNLTLDLQAYSTTIKYKPGHNNPADYLSRHPKENRSTDTQIPEQFINIIVSNASYANFTNKKLTAIKSKKWSKDLKPYFFIDTNSAHTMASTIMRLSYLLFFKRSPFKFLVATNQYWHWKLYQTMSSEPSTIPYDETLSSERGGGGEEDQLEHENQQQTRIRRKWITKPKWFENWELKNIVLLVFILKWKEM